MRKLRIALVAALALSLAAWIPAGSPVAQAAAVPEAAINTSTVLGVSMEGASATAARGTTLGASRYPMPTGAIYVSVNAGNDSTGKGTVSAPYRTLAKALAAAKAGATIVLRAGIYHESVTITQSVTVQNYPGEVVWFDGTKVVSSWQKSGNVWISNGWTALHSRTMGGTAAFRARFVDSVNPIAYYPDMLFVNGVQQTQVASAAAVTAGKFFVDESGHRLIMGSNPDGKEVRASDLERAIYSWGSKVTLQGFGVRRYATPYELRGAVVNDGANGVFRHLQLIDNATTGINVAGDNQTVENVVADRNGQQGIIGKGPGIRVLNNVVRYNNVERFKPEPVSGGIRLGKATKALVSNNEVVGSYRSYGLWFDVNCADVVIVNNILTNNERLQLEYEISKNAIIANNTATGGQAGIVIFNSENVKVFNNVVGGQSTFGMNILQDERWQTQGTASFPMRSRNIVYSNNVWGCGKYFQLYALDGYTGIPVDQMNVTITGNLFSKRLTATDPTMVAWGKHDKKTLERYETPGALAAAKGPTWKNAQTPGCSPLAEMATAIADARGVAAPLPADVAAALGVATGYKGIGLVTEPVVTAPVPNVAPKAVIASPGIAGLSVELSGTGSSDADGKVVSYEWDFGDGATGAGVSLSHTYAKAGQYTVKLRVTDDDGASDAATRTVTVGALQSGPLAKDSFTRSVASGWGSADTGGAWALSGAGARYQVAGGTGRQSLVKPGSSLAANLSGISSSATQLRASFAWDRTGHAGALYASFVPRRIDANNDYRCKPIVSSSGTVQLELTKRVAKAETRVAIQTVSGLKFAAGQRYEVACEAKPAGMRTQLNAKVWRSGSTEPTNWQVTATDGAEALQRPGSIGVSSYISSSATAAATLSVDDLVVSLAP